MMEGDRARGAGTWIVLPTYDEADNVGPITAAILLALPPEEARAVIAENMKRVQKSGEVRVKAVERMLRRSESHGYGVHLSDIVPRVNTYGVPIRDARGAPFASISIAGASEEFPHSRAPELLAVLGEAANGITGDAGALLESQP